MSFVATDKSVAKRATVNGFKSEHSWTLAGFDPMQNLDMPYSTYEFHAICLLSFDDELVISRLGASFEMIS